MTAWLELAEVLALVGIVAIVADLIGEHVDGHRHPWFTSWVSPRSHPDTISIDGHHDFLAELGHACDRGRP